MNVWHKKHLSYFWKIIENKGTTILFHKIVTHSFYIGIFIEILTKYLVKFYHKGNIICSFLFVDIMYQVYVLFSICYVLMFLNNVGIVWLEPKMKEPFLKPEPLKY